MEVSEGRSSLAHGFVDMVDGSDDAGVSATAELLLLLLPSHLIFLELAAGALVRLTCSRLDCRTQSCMPDRAQRHCTIVSHNASSTGTFTMCQHNMYAP